MAFRAGTVNGASVGSSWRISKEQGKPIRGAYRTVRKEEQLLLRLSVQKNEYIMVGKDVKIHIPLVE